MSEDVDLFGKARDPTQAGYPDQNPEDGPGIKARRKPRKKAPPSKHDSDQDSEDVPNHELFIIADTAECHYARKDSYLDKPQFFIFGENL